MELYQQIAPFKEQATVTSPFLSFSFSLPIKEINFYPEFLKDISVILKNDYPRSSFSKLRLVQMKISCIHWTCFLITDYTLTDATN